jgi:hypothetical protein
MTGLLNLVTVVEKFQTQTIAEKGALCPPTPFPPPVGHRELLVLWERLPPAHRQRLLWLLSQLLEHQLHTAVARGEDGDESASRP